VLLTIGLPCRQLRRALWSRITYKPISNLKQKYSTTTEKGCCPTFGLLMATDVSDLLQSCIFNLFRNLIKIK